MTSCHLSKLEGAGYIVVEKRFKGKRNNTIMSLIPQGRAAFHEYVGKMKKVLEDLRIECGDLVKEKECIR